MLDSDDVADVPATVGAYLERLLTRGGADEGDHGDGVLDSWADEAPALAGMAAASVQGRLALGPRAGGRVRRRGHPSPYQRPARTRVLSCASPAFRSPCPPLYTGRAADRLERVCKYVLRPPIAQERLEWTADGQVRLALKRPWADGTTHLPFEPVELLEPLAALTPRPRINLVLYHGVLAPRATWRSLVVRFGAETNAGAASRTDVSVSGAQDRRQRTNDLWANLMRRSFGIDVLECPRCRGRLRLVAVIEDPAVVTHLLRHLAVDPDSRRAPRAAAADRFSLTLSLSHRSRNSPSDGRSRRRGLAACGANLPHPGLRKSACTTENRPVALSWVR